MWIIFKKQNSCVFFGFDNPFLAIFTNLWVKSPFHDRPSDDSSSSYLGLIQHHIHCMHSDLRSCTDFTSILIVTNVKKLVSQHLQMQVFCHAHLFCDPSVAHLSGLHDHTLHTWNLTLDELYTYVQSSHFLHRICISIAHIDTESHSK